MISGNVIAEDQFLLSLSSILNGEYRFLPGIFNRETKSFANNPTVEVGQAWEVGSFSGELGSSVANFVDESSMTGNLSLRRASLGFWMLSAFEKCIRSVLNQIFQMIKKRIFKGNL